ncbi:hypothetical protein [Streptomyces mutabilis]|uniref:hypothetical protein n=1 Tax=Streptomyces mutabilis TaxID=67332 RepID=UPI0036BFECE6
MVDEVLTAQGAVGAWALYARRVLAGTGLERLAEVAESCLRGPADALMSLSGAPNAVGVKSAAKDLLAAVDTLPGPGVQSIGRVVSGGARESGLPRVHHSLICSTACSTMPHGYPARARSSGPANLARVVIWRPGT